MGGKGGSDQEMRGICTIGGGDHERKGVGVKGWSEQ